MKETVKILLVDDNAEFVAHLGKNLRIRGFDPLAAFEGGKALQVLKDNPVDIAIIDFMMPGMNGIELLRKIKTEKPCTQVVMLTAHGSIENSVLAMKEGAYDYLIKPFPVDELVLVIKKIHEKYFGGSHGVSVELKRAEGSAPSYGGTNQKVRQVMELIDTVAQTDSTVLIHSETGTGKELIARAIHSKSKRGDNPLVVLNCAALQETLLESELFGHTQGAFTGAVKEKKGLVEVADRGTLFLDEVGELGMAMQSKLLRLLEAREFRRVGDTVTHTADIRIIAATNKNLALEVEKGTFRKDLYYRLNIVTVEPPPLRDRREDIQYLASFYINKFNAAFGKSVQKISGRVLEIFMAYEWPGNVRELENAVERAMVLVKGDTIEVNELPTKLAELDPVSREEPLRTLAEIEKDYILRVLEKNEGNKARTAKILGIDRATLYNKLKEYGLKVNGDQPE